MKYHYTKAYDRRGSSMGRCNNISEPDYPVKFYLQRVLIDRGGYDPGGAYWGIGEPLYVAFGDGEEEQQEFFTRAKSREEAEEKVRKYFKNAKFWR